MKKKLEAELISIAHRILKLNSKSDINLLQQEARNLYEALTVLKFAEQNLKEVQPTIGYNEVEAAITDHYETIISHAPNLSLQEPVIENTTSAQIIQENQEAANVNFIPENNIPEIISNENQLDEVALNRNSSSLEEEIFSPAFDLIFEPKASQELPLEDHIHIEKKETQPVEVAPDNLLESDNKSAVFEQTVAENQISESIDNELLENTTNLSASKEKKTKNDLLSVKSATLNDKLSKGITVGLNDKVAFVKHLFNNSNDDYNRVLSQLITFDTLEEAKVFIDEMVKPDYDYWNGKEDYAVRFMEVVEKKFS